MAIGITHRDNIIYLQGYGTAHPNQPVTPTTPFYIGSVSKSFTALATMQLVEAGQLDLDTPVQKYLPWFQVADQTSSTTITVRHLLNQTSGLRAGAQVTTNIPSDASIETAVRLLKGVQPVQPPGKSFHYFNPNYSALGALIEVASGQSYPDYIHEHILLPLEMRNTFTSTEQARQAGLAQGYGQAFGFPIPRQQPHLAYDLPSGFIISTAEDMAHYLIAQLNAGQYSGTQVVSSDAIQIMHQPLNEINSSYAMGWKTGNINNLQTIEHSGSLETFYARVILLPDQKVGLVVLVNQNGLMNMMIFEKLIDNIVRLLQGIEPQRELSISMIYAGINLIIILDLVWKSISLIKAPRWSTWAARKSRSRQKYNILINLAFPFLVLIVLPTLSLIILGTTGTRVMLNYYFFDITLWMVIGALISSVIGIIKIRLYRKQSYSQG